MIKIEEVKLKSESVNLDLINSQSELINVDKVNDQVNSQELNSKFITRKSCGWGLLLKVLFFQFVVCCFVFLVLFSFKKIYPDKFKTISAQLSLAMNSGSKFCDGLDLNFNELGKSFNLQNQTSQNKASRQDHSYKNLNGEANALENARINLQNDSLSDCSKLENSSEKIMIDDLENISQDDGDVCFFEFVLPVNGDRVSSKFGPRIDPITQKQGDFHRGVDIPSNVGSPIWAIADGKVVQAAYSEKSGNFMIITHSNGYESRYAHCSKLLKKAGDFVKKGEKIALVGQTGNTTGPHLHVGFRKDGEWIDPKIVFPNYG